MPRLDRRYVARLRLIRSLVLIEPKRRQQLGCYGGSVRIAALDDRLPRRRGLVDPLLLELLPASRERRPPGARFVHVLIVTSFSIAWARTRDLVELSMRRLSCRQ